MFSSALHNCLVCLGFSGEELLPLQGYRDLGCVCMVQRIPCLDWSSAQWANNQPTLLISITYAIALLKEKPCPAEPLQAL